MSLKPNSVQLLELGIVKLELTASDPGSLNGRRGPDGITYDGRATSVKIFGPAGSGVTFYDDQKFRPGENAVYIEKLTDEPIEVFLGRNFVDTSEKIGSAIIDGREPEFRWVLFKTPEKDWWDKLQEAMRNVVDWDTLLAVAAASGNPKVQLGAGVVAVILSQSNRSNNYRVDNCSSVQFAGASTPPDICKLENLASKQWIYSNPDGRFGTVREGDYPDQYWRLIEGTGAYSTYVKLENVESKQWIYSNSDGRFGTFRGGDYPDQYWKLIEGAGAYSGYFKLENFESKQWIYSNSDGRFGTFRGDDYPDQYWRKTSKV